jgi:GT2 family glycosyltransferase
MGTGEESNGAATAKEGSGHMSEAGAIGRGDRAGPPTVLVIVVHWNGLEHTEVCLRSLAGLTYPAVDVLVVDNGSTDGSGKELAARFPGVRILRLEENRFYAGGANRGLQLALARGYAHAVILNNDTEAAPDLIERLVEVAESNPAIGLVGPKIFHLDPPHLIWSAGGRIDYWRGMFHHLGLRQPDGPAFDLQRDVDYLTGCCILITRSALIDVGYLDTGFTMYSEDADWCVRARRLGYRVVFAPRALLGHRVSAASGGGLTPYKMYHRVRSNLRFFQRYAQVWHWPAIAFWLPLEFGRFAVRELRHGNRRVVAAAFKALNDVARRAPRQA